jgi:hypothetical protein
MSTNKKTSLVLCTNNPSEALCFGKQIGLVCAGEYIPFPNKYPHNQFNPPSIGSKQYFIQKYGKGFIVELELKRAEAHSVMKEIEDSEIKLFLRNKFQKDL